jgi:hypothetical protein
MKLRLILIAIAAVAVVRILGRDGLRLGTANSPSCMGPFKPATVQKRALLAMAIDTT